MSGIIQKVAPSEVVVEPPTDNGKLDANWYIDEGVLGAGDRPEWLESKFKTVKDLATSYKELEKRVGGGGTAPEDYDWGDYKELFDVENPHLADLKNKAKELKLSQDAFKALVDPFANYHKSLMPDVDKEIEKLGEYAKMKIDTVNQWASNHLSDNAIETLGKISHTADVFNLMDEIRQLHSQTLSKVPTHVQASARIETISVEQVQQEIVENYDRYKGDSSYRNQLNAKLKQATGEE